MRKNDISKYLSLIKVITSIGQDKNKFCSLIQCLDDKSIRFLCELVKNGISLRHVSNLSIEQRSQFLKLITPYKSLLKRICRKSKLYSMNKKKLIQKRGRIFYSITVCIDTIDYKFTPKIIIYIYLSGKWFTIKVLTFKGNGTF